MTHSNDMKALLLEIQIEQYINRCLIQAIRNGHKTVIISSVHCNAIETGWTQFGRLWNQNELPEHYMRRVRINVITLYRDNGFDVIPLKVAKYKGRIIVALEFHFKE